MLIEDGIEFVCTFAHLLSHLVGGAFHCSSENEKFGEGSVECVSFFECPERDSRVEVLPSKIMFSFLFRIANGEDNGIGIVEVADRRVPDLFRHSPT